MLRISNNIIGLGISALCLGACEKEAPPAPLQPGLTASVSALPIETSCLRPGVTPHLKNIKSVWMKPHEILVRYNGEHSYYDMNPRDGRDLPEFYTTSAFSPRTQSIMMRDLGEPLEQQVKQRATKHYPLREKPATLCEEQLARQYYQVGIEYARKQIAAHQRRVDEQQDVEVAMSMVNSMSMTFKDGLTASFYSYNKYDGDIVMPHIHQMVLKEGGRRVVIADRSLLKPILSATETLFAELASNLVKNQRALRAAQEKASGQKKPLERLPYY